MNGCLSDEQIEDVLAGQSPPEASAHLDGCGRCRGRLVDAQRLGARLRTAFEPVHAPAGLAERVAAATVNPPVATGPPAADRRRWLRRYGSPLAAAAAVMLATAAVLYFWPVVQATPARAAARELIGIHEQVLGRPDHLITHASGAETQAYLAERLGFTPAVPGEPVEATEPRLRACCVLEFLGAQAGTMVVDGPSGPISIVVAEGRDNPLRSSGRDIEQGGRTFWVCPMKGYFTVAVQQGRLIYCAVGTDSPQNLASLLTRLLDRPTTRSD